MWDEPNGKLRCQRKRLKEPRKGVDSSRQQDGGHGSWISAKKCVTTYLPNESVPKMDGAKVSG